MQISRGEEKSSSRSKLKLVHLLNWSILLAGRQQEFTNKSLPACYAIASRNDLIRYSSNSRLRENAVRNQQKLYISFWLLSLFSNLQQQQQQQQQRELF